MGTRTWILGADRIELKESLFSRVRLTHNDDEVARGHTRCLRDVSLELTSGQHLGFHVDHKPGEGYHVELRHEGRYVPDVLQLKRHRCNECRMQLPPLEMTCAGCGDATNTAPSLARAQRAVDNARGTLKVLVFLFVASAAFTYYVNGNETEDALAHLSQFQDDEVLLPIDGVTYTAGELRAEVVRERWLVVGLPVLLALAFLGLAVWARRAPYPALVTGASLYGAVLLVNAIADPSTISSGFVVKIVVIGSLARALKSAKPLGNTDPGAPAAF